MQALSSRPPVSAARPPVSAARPTVSAARPPVSSTRPALAKRNGAPQSTGGPAKQTNKEATPSNNVVAAKEMAAARSREGARVHRKAAVDPIRERVRAEMRAEAAAAKQKAQVKIDEIEARDEAARSEQLERDALRQEVRADFRRNLREIAAAEEEEAQQAALSPESIAPPAPPSAEDATAPAAEERPAEPGHAERIQLLMQERAARIRDDAQDVNAFRQRVAARKFDPSRFGPASSANAPSVVDRSLFRPLAVPTDAAPAPSAAPPVARSEAAQSAWEWINNGGPTVAAPPPVSEI